MRASSIPFSRPKYASSSRPVSRRYSRVFPLMKPSRARSFSGSSSPRNPSTVADPEVGVTSVPIIRSSVVFPAPLGPEQPVALAGVDGEAHPSHRQHVRPLPGRERLHELIDGEHAETLPDPSVPL